MFKMADLNDVIRCIRNSMPLNGALPGKLAPPIEAQVVRCVNVKCARDFPVLSTEEIVDGPYEV